MTKQNHVVWVVDDDPDVLGGVTLLLRSYGFTVESCQSGQELLERCDRKSPGCVLLDLRMPGMNGLEVQSEMKRRGYGQPIVFLSGHGDIPVAVEAVRAGALDFLEKPVRGAQLFDAVERALSADRERWEREKERREARAVIESLSPREADVANLLVLGLRTREIAARLGLSPRTVEMHRARLLKRLGARTAAEAVRIIARARDTLDDE